MSFVVTKRVVKNGKTYEYKRLQGSVRVPGKKHPKSVDLGRAEAKRKRVSFGPLGMLPVFGIGYLARKAIDPGYKSKGMAKHKEQLPGHRERQEALVHHRAVDGKHGVDMTSEDRYHASLGRMSQEERNEWVHDRLSPAVRTHAQEKPQAFQELQDRITAPPAPDRQMLGVPKEPEQETANNDKASPGIAEQSAKADTGNESTKGEAAHDVSEAFSGSSELSEGE